MNHDDYRLAGLVAGEESVMTDLPPLTLYSRGLLSKWGFSDGDVAWDWLYDHDDCDVSSDEAHELLRALVRKYLLPEVRQHHTVEVFDIDTNHNPIRASLVDGAEPDLFAAHVSVELRPESVAVSGIDVLAALAELRTNRGAS